MILVVLAVVIALICIGIVGMNTFVRNTKSNLDKLASTEISNVNLSAIVDGAYTGRYKVFPIDVEVKVVVKDHRIDQVELVKHRNGKGAPAEAITGKVVEAQSLQVDAISGATYSSKVILKAIESALQQPTAP